MSLKLYFVIEIMKSFKILILWLIYLKASHIILHFTKFIEGTLTFIYSSQYSLYSARSLTVT